MNLNQRPGEAARRDRMRALYGKNQPITTEYAPSLAAVCHNGTFVGREEDGVRCFRGIPYAKPPVGPLRWKEPQDAEKDSGVYEAYYFGHSPIQTEWPSEMGSYYPQSEDCLTLNVWTAAKPGEHKAVMVFFHGGSYGWGATSDPIYDGHNLIAAHRDVVLVTVEYRLGLFGFIDFSEVEGGEEFASSGNLGLLDHVCALRWVRDNIAAFGGDPENVTIFGESAGGGTVSLLPIMKQAKGLFHRVIAQSGSVALTFSRSECLGLARRLLKSAGVHTMKELMALSEETLSELNRSLNDFNNFPERDGVVLPEDLYLSYQNGDASDVDMMMGTNSDEVRYWINEMGYYSDRYMGRVMFKLGTPVMYDAYLNRMSREERDAIEKRYMKLFPGRKLWKIIEFHNDLLFRCPAVAQAESHSVGGGKTYLYYWCYPSAHKGLGACHAVELAYVFNNPQVTIYTGDNIDPVLMEQVHCMWTNFAKTGDPSTAQQKWETYCPQTRMTMIFDRAITAESDPMPERRELVTPLLGYYFNGCYANLDFKVPLIYKLVALLAAIVGIVPLLIVKGLRRIFRRKK